MPSAAGLSLHNLRPLSIEEADLAASIRNRTCVLNLVESFTCFNDGPKGIVTEFLSTMKALLDFGCQDFLVLFPAFQVISAI